MHTIRIQVEAFDVGAETTALLRGNTAIGGLGCFIGTVRDSAAGRPICAMTLEHYPGMTERELSAIAIEAAARWPLLGCTIIHRVGRLVPGAPIVLVLAASPHRHAALNATAFVIDWLKTRATFWKCEEFADGSTQWVAANHADETAADRWHHAASTQTDQPS